MSGREEYLPGSTALGNGPADAIAAMQRSVRRGFDNRPSGGGRIGAASDVSTLDGSFVGDGQLAIFTYTPDLLPFGYINPATVGAGAPLRNGLVQRQFVSQRLIGWANTFPAGPSTQPADGYSGKVSAPLPQVGGQTTKTIPASEAY